MGSGIRSVTHQDGDQWAPPASDKWVIGRYNHGGVSDSHYSSFNFIFQYTHTLSFYW